MVKLLCKTGKATTEHRPRPCLDGEERHGTSVEQPEVVDVLEAVREGHAIPSSPHLHDASRTWAVFEVGIDDANRPGVRLPGRHLESNVDGYCCVLAVDSLPNCHLRRVHKSVIGYKYTMHPHLLLCCCPGPSPDRGGLETWDK